ncbi:hypothetical protein CIN_12550 [Commensalibacter intestini A911]|uniref:Uncharacterized protein n=1 Tax=Commensalibacter intestini A911 TaxID=1088868 RepID=G6F1A2_9PROT|nr:hypothetical protein [Commensalibacter intestini]EHD13896.1 hypothetical protein CIN_12550 [Commensalibacter intestini A911]
MQKILFSFADAGSTAHSFSDGGYQVIPFKAEFTKQSATYTKKIFFL